VAAVSFSLSPGLVLAVKDFQVGSEKLNLPLLSNLS